MMRTTQMGTTQSVETIATELIFEETRSVPFGDKLDTWAIAFDPHPVLHDLMVNELLRMADSDEHMRFLAVCNRHLPKAKLVMMQNDESERVREVVARILAYEENK